METLSHPNQIRVGFQARENTYSGLLSYIIYMNKGNKYGKEKSFNSWIDGSIPIQDINNDFLSGFVLNKTVSRHYRGSSGTAAFRIYHPNGYEFEISPINFANICSNCDISSGEIMEPCTLAWDAAELVLIPKSFITQNLVSFNEIDVVGKLNKIQQNLSSNIEQKKYLPIKKLKGESIFLHDDGKKYFLSSFKNKKLSLISNKPASNIEKNHTLLFNPRSVYHQNTTAVDFIPYALDGNQEHVVNNEFLNKFICVIEEPLSSLLQLPNAINSLYMPFHADTKFEHYSGNANHKKQIMDGLNNFYLNYSSNNGFKHTDIVLPLTITMNNKNYLLGFSAHGVYDFSQKDNNFSDALKKHNLHPFSGLSRKNAYFNLISMENNSVLSVMSIEEFEDNILCQERSSSLFNTDEQSNPLSALNSLFQHIKNVSNPIERKVSHVDLVNRIVSFLDEIILNDTQDSAIDLNKFIVRVDPQSIS